MIDWIMFLVWLLAGVVELTRESISKRNYFLTWLALMFYLVMEIMR